MGVYGWGVRGDLLDVVLIGVVAVCAVSGFRRGFVVGALGVAGFVGGAAVGLVIAPVIARSLVSGRAGQSVLAIAVVFIAAMAGQFAASAVGAGVRGLVRWRPAAVADSAGGAVVSVLSVLVVVWLVGASAADGPFAVVAGQVGNSVVLGAVNRLMPPAAQTWFSSFRAVLASGSFPLVDGLDAAATVAAPATKVVASSGVRGAGVSVVKVIAAAPECSLRVAGSGFVVAAVDERARCRRDPRRPGGGRPAGAPVAHPGGAV